MALLPINKFQVGSEIEERRRLSRLMEESNCPGQSSRSPSRRYHSSDPDRNQTSDSDQAANLYTFSEEITYNSSEDSVADDVSEEEVTGYGLNQPRHKRPKNSPTDTSNAVDQNPDWISSLPDSVLLHILSFLPTEGAVATGVLSKRWLYLWTAVPNLLFRYRGSWSEGIWEFADFVSRTLLFYGCANVKKFHVDFEFHEYFKSQVHGWVRFAMRHDVEELDLDFYGDEDMHPSDGGHYKLPQFLYSYGLLKKLNLRFCQIVPSGLIDWKFLKILSISYAILSDDLAEKILSGSPVLESLELYKCCGISYFDVKSASLRKLVVNDYWDSPETNEDMVLEISGPNLQSLDILGFLYGKHCRVRNVSSLVDVTLNFQLLSQFDVDLDYNEYEEYQNMLREILENLHHVKKLTIGKWCIQVLSKCEMREMPSPLSKRNCLILDTCLHRWEPWDLPGIASLLRSSPALETLVINVTSPHCAEFEFDANSSKACDFIVEKYFNFRKMNFKNSLLSLKTVEVVGFIAGARQSYLVITLLEFLLKNARVLEKMVICARTDHIRRGMSPRPEDLHTVGQRLLNFPRSSPYAEIVLRDMKDSHR